MENNTRISLRRVRAKPGITDNEGDASKGKTAMGKHEMRIVITFSKIGKLFMIFKILISTLECIRKIRLPSVS